MADLWYYTSEGRQMEPIPTAEIIKLARSGRLKPTDMVWREGMPRWVRASAAPEIFPDPNALLEKALAATPANPPAALPSALPAALPATPPAQPILLDAVETAKSEKAASAQDSKTRPRRRADEEQEAWRRRRRKKNPYAKIIVMIAIFAAVGLLLVVLVLGLVFIALSR